MKYRFELSLFQQVPNQLCDGANVAERKNPVSIFALLNDNYADTTKRTEKAQTNNFTPNNPKMRNSTVSSTNTVASSIMGKAHQRKQFIKSREKRDDHLDSIDRSVLMDVLQWETNQNARKLYRQLWLKEKSSRNPVGWYIGSLKNRMFYKAKSWCLRFVTRLWARFKELIDK